MNAPKPSWRKPAGILLLLLLIAAWGFVVVTVAEALPEMPWPLKALFFVAAGLVWILPLKPLLRWMETGKFRKSDASAGMSTDSRP